MPLGPAPTLWLATTVRLAVSITEKVPASILLTCTRRSNRQGVTLMPLGPLPTGTVFVTLRSFTSSTETELA